MWWLARNYLSCEYEFVKKHQFIFCWTRRKWQSSYQKNSQTCPGRVSLKEPFSNDKNLVCICVKNSLFLSASQRHLLCFSLPRLVLCWTPGVPQYLYCPPVTKIQPENSFLDVHGPNPIIQRGMLMQFQGYMAFLWICICEVRAEPDFEDVPGSFLMSQLSHSARVELPPCYWKAEVTHRSWLDAYQPLKFQPFTSFYWRKR